MPAESVFESIVTYMTVTNVMIQIKRQTENWGQKICSLNMRDKELKSFFIQLSQILRKHDDPR